MAHGTQVCFRNKLDQRPEAGWGFDRGGSRLGKEERQRKRIIKLRGLVQQGVGVALKISAQHVAQWRVLRALSRI